MSNLRIIGIVIGIIGLLSTFMFYRGPKWKRSNFILFSFFNLALIIVSVNPNVLNVLRDVLALQNAQRGRILALLVMSNIFLLFYILIIKSKIENISLQFDKLVRSLGSNGIDDSLMLGKKIKPIMVLIPAYNESKNLKLLLPTIPEKIEDLDVGVLVVDDGSEDDTSSLGDDNDEFLIVRNMINRGGGAALRLGYDILRKAEALVCVTMDADGQHRPEEIESLVRPILNDTYDFVIGSRILGRREKDSIIRYMGILFFGRIISFLLGMKITDPSSGFRAFRIKAIEAVNLYEDQYHTSELIIDAIKKGMRVGEVPITILKRKYGISKKGKEWIYGLHFAKTVIKTWWR